MLIVRCVQLLYYTIPGGKMNRGLTVLHSLQALKGRALTDEETHQVCVCVCEWFFLPALDALMHGRRVRGYCDDLNFTDLF